MSAEALQDAGDESCEFEVVVADEADMSRGRVLGVKVANVVNREEHE
jgi:hypothetical protein